jgi:hypothetical protein
VVGLFAVLPLVRRDVLETVVVGAGVG